MSISGNIPYVKQYNELGDVRNPITVDRPYLNPNPGRKALNGSKRHRGNNKGHAIVVVGNVKYFKSYQAIPLICNGRVVGSRTIEHSIAR